ncbi:MAG: hypothetical protein FWG03_09985 [Clostridiales bacterium]|nr:hypothetical protein [Clostridiales bacterium]
MKAKRIISCALVAGLLAALIGFGPTDAWGHAWGPVLASAGTQYGSGAGGGSDTVNPAITANPANPKDEVVYARLGAGGAVDSVYVVNHFEVGEAGSITDFGVYSSVQNLTDTGGITQNGDAVSFEASSEDFYYQGNMGAAGLPWEFGISWYMDGLQTPAPDMAGRSGNMEFRLSSRRNVKMDQTFYDNYMLQITITLDTAKCKGIEAPGAMVAEAGKNKAVTWTVMPGNDADLTLTAVVSDFAMDGIQISGVPWSMEFDIPDTDDRFDDLNKLPDAISELNDGVKEFLDGTTDLKAGADKLVNGSSDIRDGISLLSGGSGQLTGASAQIKSALEQIAGALSGSPLDSIDPDQIAQLPKALKKLAAGLDEMSGSLGLLKTGFLQSYGALDGAMAGIPGPLTEEQIAGFYMSIPTMPAEQQAVANELLANYAAAQTAKGTYDAVKPGFDAVAAAIDGLVPGLDGMSLALKSMAEGVKEAAGSLDGLEQLGELAEGLEELSRNYSAFHTGLVGYTGGVDALSENYSAFHNGLASFSSGVGELSSGARELFDGTSTLNSEISSLPDDLKKEIDKMKEQYMPADFDTVSFTSPKNTNTVYVQFVIRGGDIEKPEQEKEEPPEEKTETIWDRLLALFTGSVID